MILNIETSSKRCSVSFCDNGETWMSRVSGSEMDHSVKLAPFVEECLQELKAAGKNLDAVAVSIGPGSYTGLRIGLSLAKGLCFAMSIPLIGVPTLQILAVKAMFKVSDFNENTLLVPLIDARRMEVYTATYDAALKAIEPPRALILDGNSFEELKDREVIMVGDGVEKARRVLNIPVKHWLDNMPSATDMNALSELAWRKGDFMDVAYSTPFYLKNFQATTPKNKF